MGLGSVGVDWVFFGLDLGGLSGLRWVGVRSRGGGRGIISEEWGRGEEGMKKRRYGVGES